MPAKDNIPSKEGALVPWTENFIAVVNSPLTEPSGIISSAAKPKEEIW